MVAGAKLNVGFVQPSRRKAHSIQRCSECEKLIRWNNKSGLCNGCYKKFDSIKRHRLKLWKKKLK